MCGSRVFSNPVTYAKICILMVLPFCVLRHKFNTQRNAVVIDSESKSVKLNADLQNCLTVCFYMLLQYYHTVRKHSWLEQSALMPSASWPSMHDCFNWLEDSNNYSASIWQTNVAKIRVLSQEGVSKVKCYTYHSNHVIYIMVTIISLVFLLFHPV